MKRRCDLVLTQRSPDGSKKKHEKPHESWHPDRSHDSHLLTVSKTHYGHSISTREKIFLRLFYLKLFIISDELVTEIGNRNHNIKPNMREPTPVF
jgi:hypothetical protein